MELRRNLYCVLPVSLVLLLLSACGSKENTSEPEIVTGVPETTPAPVSSADMRPAVKTARKTARKKTSPPREEKPVLSDNTVEGRIWSLALSRDGKKLVAGVQGPNGPPNELILWELEPRREVFRVSEPRASRSVAFSPDGETIVTGGFGTVARLFDAKDGRVLRPLPGHKAGINSVAFALDGKSLATGSWDTTVKIWNLATGKAQATLEGHTDQVYSVAYSPDGQTLASCGRDGTARLWDVDSASEKLSLKGHKGVVEFITYSPDGKTIATAGWDKTLRLWDAATGQQLVQLDGASDQLAAAFSSDGKIIASVSAPTKEPSKGLTSALALWDVATHKPIATIPAHADRSYCVLFTPDGKTLITASMDRTIKFWDVATQQLKETLTTGTASAKAP
jgi:WD40 repeat protein